MDWYQSWTEPFSWTETLVCFCHSTGNRDRLMDRDEIASALRELEAKVRRLEDEQVEELKRVQTKVKYNY